MTPQNRNAIRRVNRARRFPDNTCGASRALQGLAWDMAAGKPIGWLGEDRELVAAMMLSVVEDLYKARTEIARLKGGV